MERLLRYKIKESTLSDLFNKKKTNDRIKEDISEKNKLLEGYKQEETLLNQKYNDSVQLVESMNELDIYINKTTAKLEKSEMEYDRSNQCLSQWEDNYRIHLDNIETQRKINDLKQKREQEVISLKEIQNKLDLHNELISEKDVTEKIILETEQQLFKLKSKKELLEADLLNIDYYQDNTLREKEKIHYKDILEKSLSERKK